MKCSLLKLVALTIALLALPLPLQAAEAHIAVAANFTAPMKVIARNFERETGHTLTVSFGATGQFYSQIQNGAPFAVLLAADEQTPVRLVQDGLADAASRFTYATGKLVLWSAKAGLVDDQGSILRTGAFEKVAIANPKTAPYGAAAMQTLTHLELLEKIKPKIVEGANIAQTYHFVATENAALGFVALSQVIDNGKIKHGSAWIVPSTMHAPIKQDAVLLTAGKHNVAARSFLNYLKTDAAKTVIRNYGYVL